MAGLQVRPPAMLFDLDGTLINSVYQHVLAWQEALTSAGIELSIWRLHRRVGMSGGLFVTALLRETGGTLSSDQIGELNQAHTEAYARRRDTVRPLPGARELLATLTERKVKWIIATSGTAASARPALDMLGLPSDTPLVTRDEVRHAKPDPDLFLAAAERISVDIGSAIVGGDSIWDLLAARRAHALGPPTAAGPGRSRPDDFTSAGRGSRGRACRRRPPARPRGGRTPSGGFGRRPGGAALERAVLPQRKRGGEFQRLARTGSGGGGLCRTGVSASSPPRATLGTTSSG
jgi:HAD superfamily hydrolase (TIGR01549 family)